PQRHRDTEKKKDQSENGNPFFVFFLLCVSVPLWLVLLHSALDLPCPGRRKRGFFVKASDMRRG
ncbi:MAG: hypothetical protein ACRELF_22735, partial [Gemmataceae bacterium]